MPLVRSYRTISPLPTGPLDYALSEAWRPIMQRGRYLFCGTVREVTLPGRYPAPCPAESGLSSRPPKANRRPSDRLRPLPTYSTWARFATTILTTIGLIDARYRRVQDLCSGCIVQCARYPRGWMRYRSQVLWTKNRSRDLWSFLSDVFRGDWDDGDHTDIRRGEQRLRGTRVCDVVESSLRLSEIITDCLLDFHGRF